MSLAGKRARDIPLEPPSSVRGAILAREEQDEDESDAASNNSGEDASLDRDAASVAASSDGLLQAFVPKLPEFDVYHLPPDADHLTYFPSVWDGYRRAYSWLAMGVQGGAKLFCSLHEDLFTCKNRIWVFDASAALWTQLSDDELMSRAGTFLRTIYGEVKAPLSEIVQFLEEREEKDAVKPWKAAVARLSKCVDTISSHRGLVELLKLIKIQSTNEGFEDTLDSDPLLLSVQNGVLNLKTATVSKRTPEHRMTFELSYPFDAEADETPMRDFVLSLFESEEDAAAVQATLAYWLTGLTKIKRFWQIAAPTQSGKTTLFTILKAVFQKYASMGEVPIEELTSSSFEDALVKVLTQRPRVRLLIWDEIGDKVSFKEAVLNQLTDGKKSTSISLRKKGKAPETVVKLFCKLAFLTNHELKLPASATGLVRRNTGWGLKLRFLGPGEALGAMERRADSTFETNVLEDDAFKAGVLKYIVQGVQRLFLLEEEALMCPRFVDASFKLHIRGDVYLEWITDSYYPTGKDADKVPLDAMVRDFRAAKRSAKSDDAAYDGIKSALESMNTYIYALRYSEYGVLIQGYSGLRERIASDIEWCQAISDAKAARTLL
jgi:hypothetical protein